MRSRSLVLTSSLLALSLAVPASSAEPTSKLAQSAHPPGAEAGLVHKSYSYWRPYGDLIKQLFNGSYASDINSSTAFRELFATYVYSARCRAYLPAKHDTLALTRSTEYTDKYGNVVNRNMNDSYSVEVDSRFAPMYRDYAASLGSTSSETLGLALGVASGRINPSTVFAPATDMAKFFNTEACQARPYISSARISCAPPRDKSRCRMPA
jgi:hypothetical protein